MIMMIIIAMTDIQNTAKFSQNLIITLIFLNVSLKNTRQIQPEL